jgi:protein-S-isoprenylcysteine O-methyltransferase Ste14
MLYFFKKYNSFLLILTESLKSMKTRHLKTIGLIAGCLAAVVLASPTKTSLITGGIIVVIGELIRLWATGHLNRNQELTTSGPYAYVRDPLYLGRFFLIIGFSVMGWGYCLILLPVGLVIFYINYLPRKYKKEMTRLENLFGDDYRNYSAYARSLLPRLKPYPQANKRSWSFDACWGNNREQYFILIVAAVATGITTRYLI